MPNLTWKKCGDDHHWCSFDNLTLDMETVGVYMIWHEGDPSRVVRLGQGKIAERIKDHRNDAKITAYKKHGTLRVTWASVARHQLDGVERHLADTWNPLVGEAFPDVDPIAVNSPF